MFRSRLLRVNPAFMRRKRQTEGCPQLISEQEASARAMDDSIPGNIINLSSEGDGGS